MRFTSIVAVLVAAVSAAPGMTATQANDAAIIAKNIGNLKALFQAVPPVEVVIAKEFPELAKDDGVDFDILSDLPSALVGTATDLVQSIPGVLVDTVGSILQVPGNLLSFVDDIVTGSLSLDNE